MDFKNIDVKIAIIGFEISVKRSIDRYQNLYNKYASNQRTLNNLALKIGITKSQTQIIPCIFP